MRGMMIDMNDRALQTLAQLRAFLDGTQPLSGFLEEKPGAVPMYPRAQVVGRRVEWPRPRLRQCASQPG